MLLELVDRGLPKLPAAVPAPADEVRLEIRCDLLGGNRLEIVEALARVRRDRGRYEHERRDHHERPPQRLAGAGEAEPEAGSERVDDPGADTGKGDVERRLEPLTSRRLARDHRVLRGYSQRCPHRRRARDQDCAGRLPAQVRSAR